MRKLLLFIAILFASNSFGQLSKVSKFYQVKHPDVFNFVLAQAKSKWDDDYSMISYTVNEQLENMDALLDQYRKYLTGDKGLQKDILLKALKKWEVKGQTDFNNEHLHSMATWEKLSRPSSAIEEFEQLRVDWKMVVYEYLKQAKAKLELMGGSVD